MYVKCWVTVSVTLAQHLTKVRINISCKVLLAQFSLYVRQKDISHIHSFTYSFIYLFVHSCIHLYIHLFVHSIATKIYAGWHQTQCSALVRISSKSVIVFYLLELDFTYIFSRRYSDTSLAGDIIIRAVFVYIYAEYLPHGMLSCCFTLLYYWLWILLKIWALVVWPSSNKSGEVGCMTSSPDISVSMLYYYMYDVRNSVLPIRKNPLNCGWSWDPVDHMLGLFQWAKPSTYSTLYPPVPIIFGFSFFIST